MLVVMVRIGVASDEEGNALANRFRNRAGLVDNQPGFIGFELLKGEGEYISVTRWMDRESLDAWTRSQAHGQAHARVPAAEGSGGAEVNAGTGGGASASQPSRPMGGGVSVYEVIIPAD